MNVRRAVAGGTIVAAVLAVAVVLARTALIEDGADMAPSPESTYERSDSRAQNVADAMTAFIAYMRVSDEVAQNHFSNWEEKVKPLTSGEVQEWHEDYDAQAEAEHYNQVGERVVESIHLKPGRYRVDADGLGRADLGACIDNTELQVAAPGSQDDGLPPGRYSVSVMMVLWPDGWKVSQYSIDDPQLSETGMLSCRTEGSE